MKVKRLMANTGLARHEVVEMADGKYYRFEMTPAREITEKDLTEVPYYNPVGEHAEEAGIWMYNMYGPEKER